MRALALLATAVLTATAADPTAHVSGLSVVLPPPGWEQPGADQPRAFNQMPGTAVALRLAGGDAPIRSVDAARSRLERASDDRGTDLLQAGAPVLEIDGFSADGTAAGVCWRLPGLPTAAARSLRLQGAIALLVGGEPRTQRLPASDLAAGARLTAGAATWRITAVGPSRWQDGGIDVAVTPEGDHSAVQQVTFLRGDAEVAVRRFSVNDGAQQVWVFNQAPTAVALDVRLLAGARTVAVPFAVEAATGLPPLR